MKTKILYVLRNTKDYISGQELCRELGVSRTAVWKVMNQLKEEGYVIEAVPNRGYHLVSSPNLLSESEILSKLNTEWAGREVIYFEETDSTNTRAKELAEAGKPHGTLVVADMQTAGKGRRGRGWSSPKGTGIFMTLILKPDLLPTKASMLTLVAALAVESGIAMATGIRGKIKWPNDIVVNGKKICGILTEMSAEMEGIHHVVVGIGINANMKSFPAEIQKVATSLSIEKQEEINRSDIICEIMKKFEYYYEKFIKEGDLSLLVEEYNGKMVNQNERVKVIGSEEEFQGTARGITKTGELVIDKDGEGIVTVLSGEVSVRGVYGYV